MLLPDGAEGAEQAGLQIVEAIAVEAVAQDDDQLAAGWQLMCVLAKEFAEDALPVVAFDRVAHPAAGDDTETLRSRLGRYAALGNKKSAVDTMTHTADSLKFAWPFQTHWG